MFDHLLHQCCWPLVWTVYSDVPLLNEVTAVSGFTLALAFTLASRVLVAVPIGFAALGALCASFLGSVISPATRPFMSSFSTMPRSRSVWSLFACSFAGLVPCPSTLCRLRVVRTDITEVQWCRSVIGHHFIDDLQLFHDFVELPQ